MIKAIFFDIDGTLVSFRTHSIPASTIEAISEAKRRGAMIFISTGRPKPLINNIEPIEPLIDGYITVNGAICTINGATISSTPLCPEDVRSIIDAVDKWDVPSLIVGEDRAIVHNHKPIVDQVFGHMLAINGLDTTTSTQEMLSRPVYQLTPFFNQKQESEASNLLRRAETTRWCEYFSDIISSDADKGKGMATVAAHLGIDVSECMAFGDGGNDIPILRMAATGVAMGNAGDSVKAAADYVTDHIDDDGVMKALRHFGIIS